MKVTASHNYLCRRIIYDELKDTIPRSIPMRGVHKAIFEAIVSDPDFRESLVEEGSATSFEGEKDFAWIDLGHLKVCERKKINKAIREVLAEIDNIREIEGHLGISGVVTIAYRMCISGEHKLQFS